MKYDISNIVVVFLTTSLLGFVAIASPIVDSNTTVPTEAELTALVKSLTEVQTFRLHDGQPKKVSIEAEKYGTQDFEPTTEKPDVVNITSFASVSKSKSNSNNPSFVNVANVMLQNKLASINDKIKEEVKSHHLDPFQSIKTITEEKLESGLQTLNVDKIKVSKVIGKGEKAEAIVTISTGLITSDLQTHGEVNFGIGVGLGVGVYGKIKMDIPVELHDIRLENGLKGATIGSVSFPSDITTKISNVWVDVKFPYFPSQYYFFIDTALDTVARKVVIGYKKQIQNVAGKQIKIALNKAVGDQFPLTLDF
eukprot:Pgem_evm1s4696